MSVIIKDVNGGTLRLSKTRLTEVTGQTAHLRYFLLLKDLRASEEPLLNTTEHHTGKNYQPWIDAKIKPENFSIGCRTFSEKVFKQIMRAAGVKVARKKKDA
jgi:hypothetical protein